MEADYYQILKNRILSILKVQPLNICSIIKRSFGAYPDDVLFCLNELLANKLVFINNTLYQLLDFEYSLPIHENNDDKVKPNIEWLDNLLTSLSKPHPADYDWRFTNKTIYELSQLVIRNRSLYPKVALFGVTTLFPVIKTISPEFDLSLFNKSKSLIGDLTRMGFNDGLYVQDLFSKIPFQKKYNLVVADPPWYNDFYRVFICRASEILDLGGLLYLSVLPILTRPYAEIDRIYVDECCAENGLKKIEAKTGFLSYESPDFERHSLANKGVDCLDWRKGDLVIYEKISETSSANKILPTTVEPKWEEFIINGIKIKLLMDDDHSDRFSFENSDVTQTLSTVSRRSPVRERINFWTSDNFAFNVTKIKVLRYLFTFVSSGRPIKKGLIQTKNEEKLTEIEFDSLISLLKKANII